MKPDATMELVARVSALVAARLQIEAPDPDTDLIEGGYLDSLAFVDLLASLESTFGITVSLDDLDLDAFRTIAKIAAFVAGRS